VEEVVINQTTVNCDPEPGW